MTAAPAPPAASRLSLRLKLTLWMLAIATVIHATLGTVIVLYERAAITEFVDAQFERRARAIAASVSGAGLGLSDEQLVEASGGSRLYLAFANYVVTLYGPDGEPVASSHRPARPARDAGVDRAVLEQKPLFGAGLDPAIRPDAEVSVGRTALMPIRAPDGRLYVLYFAAADTGYTAFLRLVLLAPLIAIPLGVFASGVAAWLIAGVATAPFQHLRELTGALAPEAIEADLEPPRSTPEVASLQAGIEEVRDKLRQAFRARDRFIANVSHELKTPIAVLLTEAQTLRAEDLPDRVKSFVQSVTEEMRRLGRMVESFLTLSRLHAGEGLTVAEPCRVNDFVTQSVQECGRLAAQYGVRLDLHLASEPLAPVAVGDQELLRVMVENLIRNAVRFSPEHETVGVHVAAAPGECRIAVRDAGSGIPEAILGTLFDRFTQAQSEQVVRGRGHGLGLSIAQGIAELHGGRIIAANLPERGCEFTVWLPLLPTGFRSQGAD